MKNYYFIKINKQFGPHSREELLEEGISPETLVWQEGFDNWEKASDVPDLSVAFQKDSSDEKSSFETFLKYCLNNKFGVSVILIAVITMTAYWYSLNAAKPSCDNTAQKVAEYIVDWEFNGGEEIESKVLSCQQGFGVSKMEIFIEFRGNWIRSNIYQVQGILDIHNNGSGKFVVKDLNDRATGYMDYDEITKFRLFNLDLKN